MKKIAQTILIIFSAFILTTEAKAQFSVGGGLLYGFEIERPGLRLDGLYDINEDFRAALDFGYYFPESEFGVKYNWWELNLNAHYLFVDNDGWTAYALAGINYLKFSFSEDFDNPPGSVGFNAFAQTMGKSSDVITHEMPLVAYGATDPFFNDSGSETGLNIGIGGEYKVNFGTVFGELKLAGLGGADQFTFGIGVRYKL